MAVSKALAALWTGNTRAPSPSLIHRSFETNCRHAAIRASSRFLATFRCSRGFLLLFYDLTPACTSGRVRRAFFSASRHDLNSLGATTVRSSPTRAFTHTTQHTVYLGLGNAPRLCSMLHRVRERWPRIPVATQLASRPSTTHSSGSRQLKRSLFFSTTELTISVHGIWTIRRSWTIYFHMEYRRLTWIFSGDYDF